jgi:hypothetical protein
MIIPMSYLYKDYLEIEKQIYSIKEINDFLTNELYGKLFNLELKIKDHPEFNDFKPAEITTPPDIVIKDYYIFLLQTYNYIVMKNITLEIIKYYMKLFIDKSNLFSIEYRDIINYGWESHILKRYNLADNFIDFMETDLVINE